MLPLVLCEDDLCLKGEEYKRRTAVLQSGSGSDLRNATLSPALPLAAAWQLFHSLPLIGSHKMLINRFHFAWLIKKQKLEKSQLTDICYLAPYVCFAQIHFLLSGLYLIWFGLHIVIPESYREGLLTLFYLITAQNTTTLEPATFSISAHNCN